MKLVRGSAILTWIEMKRYQTLEVSEYVEWDDERKNKDGHKLLCVSHRWITTDHPDPGGEQLRELQQRLKSLFEQDNSLDTYLVFYDYYSMPQSPRTAEEEVIFRKDISALNSLFLSAEKTIVLSEGYSDYKNRAWCFFEYIISSKIIYFFDDQEQIKNDLEFMRELQMEELNPINSYDFHYGTDIPDAEVIVAVFQHLSVCKVTNPDDFPLIKSQMVAYFNSRKTTSFGKILIALNKYFDVVYSIVLLLEETTRRMMVDIHGQSKWTKKVDSWKKVNSFLSRVRHFLPPSFLPKGDTILFACKPHFEQPTWIRFPIAARGDAKMSVFALPQAEFEVVQSVLALPQAEFEASKNMALPAIRLSMQGVDNLDALLKKFQQVKDWERYVVNPMRIGAINQDLFPDVDYVIHTILEVFPAPQLTIFNRERQYLYLFL